MKKELNPFVLIAVGVIAVLLLGAYGYRALQPAPYQPSPGTGGRPKREMPAYIKDAIAKKQAGQPLPAPQ